jgi:hypothetical protein
MKGGAANEISGSNIRLGTEIVGLKLVFSCGCLAQMVFCFGGTD